MGNIVIAASAFSLGTDPDMGTAVEDPDSADTVIKGNPFVIIQDDAVIHRAELDMIHPGAVDDLVHKKIPGVGVVYQNVGREVPLLNVPVYVQMIAVVCVLEVKGPVIDRAGKEFGSRFVDMAIPYIRFKRKPGKNPAVSV
jgi:hypothetical protein